MADRHPSDSPDVVALDPLESLSIFLLLREGPLHGRELDEAMAEREAFEELRRALTQLQAERERLVKDSARLDALERYALAQAERSDFSEEFARVEMVDPENAEEEEDRDEDPEREPLFEVTGPATLWGCRLGDGATLRDAIDGAMLWEHAPNLDDMDSSEPATPPSSLPREGANG